MNQSRRYSSTKYEFTEASDVKLKPGSGAGKRIEIMLEEHSISSPLRGTTGDYILDRDFPDKGWYVVDLDTPVPVYLDPVSRILIQSRGGVSDDFHERQRRYNDKGRELISYYKYPLEDMLLNPQTRIRYVLIYVAITLEDKILVERKLSHSQIWIHPFAKAMKAKS